MILLSKRKIFRLRKVKSFTEWCTRNESYDVKVVFSTELRNREVA